MRRLSTATALTLVLLPLLPAAAHGLCGSGCGADLFRARAAAFQWLVAKSAEKPQNLVDHLLLFQFASNMNPHSLEAERLRQLVRERSARLVLPLRHEKEIPKADFFDEVVGAYLLDALGAPESELRLRVEKAWEEWRLEDLLPAENESGFSVDHVNRVMIISFLKTLRIIPMDHLGRVIEPYRRQYDAVLLRGSIAEKKQLLYFAVHVVFAYSELGKTEVPPVGTRREVEILREAVNSPAIQSDNDLWPEIFLALSLVEGCRLRPHRSIMKRILETQSPDGSWTPSMLPESSRLHTTSVIFLALLRDQSCSDLP